MKQIPRWEKERRDMVREMLAEMTAMAIGSALEQVIEQFRGLQEVLEYLEEVKKDLVKKIRKRSRHKGLTQVEAVLGDQDQIGLDEVGAYDKILISPGPGIPEEAGISLDQLVAASGLDKDLVAVMDKFTDACRRCADAKLECFDFLGDPDLHEYAPDSHVYTDKIPRKTRHLLAILLTFSAFCGIFCRLECF